MRTATYSWRIYGSNCDMVGYFTDPDHVPVQWQENITEPKAKQRAIAIVNYDRAEAEATGQFTQSTINEAERIYYRRTELGNKSGWEVKLDENDQPLPNPCEEVKQPASFDVVLRLAAVSFRRDNTRVILTIVGEELRE